MKINNFHIQITSEDPDRLRSFYGDTVGLPNVPEMGEGAFAVGGANLFVDGHSETKGQAGEPQRMIVDLVVDDVATERAPRRSGRQLHPPRGQGRVGRHDLNLPRPRRKLLSARPVSARLGERATNACPGRGLLLPGPGCVATPVRKANGDFPRGYAFRSGWESLLQTCRIDFSH